MPEVAQCFLSPRQQKVLLTEQLFWLNLVLIPLSVAGLKADVSGQKLSCQAVDMPLATGRSPEQTQPTQTTLESICMRFAELCSGGNGYDLIWTLSWLAGMGW